MKSAENTLTKSQLSQIKEILQNLPAQDLPPKISISEFLNIVELFNNKENFLEHLLTKADSTQRIELLNLIEPTFKTPNFKITKLENAIHKEKSIKKFTDGKEFFYIVATKEQGKTLLTAFKTDKLNTILKEFERFEKIEGEDADIIQTFIQQGSKNENSLLGLPKDNSSDIIPQDSPKSIIKRRRL